MKQAVLVIIKPEGMVRHLAGEILRMLLSTKLEIVGSKIIKVTRRTAGMHYVQLKGQPFYKGLMLHFMGELHGCNKLLAFVLYGSDAITKCRKITGATDPREAKRNTIRGRFGRVTRGDVFENIVHTSSSEKDAKREIQLWIKPDEIVMNLYKTRNGSHGRVWA